MFIKPYTTSRTAAPIWLLVSLYENHKRYRKNVFVFLFTVIDYIYFCDKMQRETRLIFSSHTPKSVFMRPHTGLGLTLPIWLVMSLSTNHKRFMNDVFIFSLSAVDCIYFCEYMKKEKFQYFYLVQPILCLSNRIRHRAPQHLFGCSCLFTKTIRDTEKMFSYSCSLSLITYISVIKCKGRPVSYFHHIHPSLYLCDRIRDWA